MFQQKYFWDEAKLLSLLSHVLIKPNTSPVSPLPPGFQCKAEHVDGSVQQKGRDKYIKKKKTQS